jgi:ubiquinone/menaquinone biosynthesis C-methylase UbiE
LPDVWATVNELDPAMQARLADVLETRGADERQRSLRSEFLALARFPDGARIVDVGCGTGVLTRPLARLPGVSHVVGVDIAPSLLERARELAGDLPGLSFEEGDARSLPFQDASFDAAVFDSTFSHVPGPEAALSEAFRVIRPGGVLAIFDGDYATTTVAIGDNDPLQDCVLAMMANSLTDRWIMRRMPTLARASGFEDVVLRSHGFVETGDAAYMLTVIDRGADILRDGGQIGGETAEALKAEGRRRVAEGRFFGHIAYASVIARRP